MIDSLPIEMREKLYEMFDNKLVMIPLMFAAAVGTVIAIAGGFYATYLVVTMIGAS